MHVGCRTLELSQVWRGFLLRWLAFIDNTFYPYHRLSVVYDRVCHLDYSLLWHFEEMKTYRMYFEFILGEIYYKVILTHLLIHLNIFSICYIQGLRSFTENPMVRAMWLIIGNMLLANHLQVLSRERGPLPSSLSLYSSTSLVAITFFSDGLRNFSITTFNYSRVGFLGSPLWTSQSPLGNEDSRYLPHLLIPTSLG